MQPLSVWLCGNIRVESQQLAATLARTYIINSCARVHKYIFLNLRHAHSVRVRLFLSEEPSCFSRCISRASLCNIFGASKPSKWHFSSAHRMSRWFSSSRFLAEAERVPKAAQAIPKRAGCWGAGTLLAAPTAEWVKEWEGHSFICLSQQVYRAAPARKRVE